MKRRINPTRVPIEQKESYRWLYAETGFVEMLGPETGRPHVGTLKASNYANMKELPFGRRRRVAFAFDPKRRAILLVAGDKTGDSEAKSMQGMSGT